MLRLRKILLYNQLYLIILIVSFIYVFLININGYSFTKGNVSLNGVIEKKEIDGDQLRIIIKTDKGKFLGNYYFDTYNEKKLFVRTYNYGDYMQLKGETKEVEKSTIKNGFNYRNYLKSKKIKGIISIDSYEKIRNNKNFIFYIKTNLYKYFEKYKSYSYLKAFIVGDTSDINQDISRSYQEIGISHLLAISGGNIAFLAIIVLFLLKKIKVGEDKRYIITCLFLFLYLFIVGLTPSVFRAVLFFVLLSINKIYYFNIKTLNIFILTLSFIVINNPCIIYDLGFQFSFFISFFLIVSQEYLAVKNSFLSLYRVSIISFIASFPIVVSNFYKINLLSILYNLFFVPFVSLIIFPLSLIILLIPFLDNIFFFLISIMEMTSLLLSDINIFNIILGHNNLFSLLYFLLSILIIYFIPKRKYKFIIILIIAVLIHSNYNNLFHKKYITLIDVGTGDSILIHLNGKNLLIDTGGKVNTFKEKWMKKEQMSLYHSRLEPLFLSLGISKLDYLILTHGDYDHMGEAINLINDFKVDNVIFNLGRYNNLEKDLIKILEKKDISYYQGSNILNIGNDKLYFLNTKDYNDENENSNVIYSEINNTKILLMGDAGVEREKDILEKYNLIDIDILKVGHHGSNTSSSKEFISEINPKNCLISVGKNNRYGHPKESVLSILNNCNIYRTDLEGSIEIKIKDNDDIFDS
ncbi:MAG: DNA internalization-related competence protein ComEC/Rec2 [Bacilli bacterium]|nr:DNA internalization-related competence protein ComEC/Rec2 [Bacilli bacterium]